VACVPTLRRAAFSGSDAVSWLGQAVWLPQAHRAWCREPRDGVCGDAATRRDRARRSDVAARGDVATPIPDSVAHRQNRTVTHSVAGRWRLRPLDFRRRALVPSRYCATSPKCVIQTGLGLDTATELTTRAAVSHWESPFTHESGGTGVIQTGVGARHRDRVGDMARRLALGSSATPDGAPPDGRRRQLFPKWKQLRPPPAPASKMFRRFSPASGLTQISLDTSRRLPALYSRGSSDGGCCGARRAPGRLLIFGSTRRSARR
jgi:hypothetical protein